MGYNATEIGLISLALQKPKTNATKPLCMLGSTTQKHLWLLYAKHVLVDLQFMQLLLGDFSYFVIFWCDLESSAT